VHAREKIEALLAFVTAAEMRQACAMANVWAEPRRNWMKEKSRASRCGSGCCLRPASLVAASWSAHELLA
jgi:hypothetical protein